MTIVRLGVADDMVALVRTAHGEAVTIDVMPGRDALALALVRASIGPLAIEVAPRRVNAVARHGNAAGADVDAALGFLENAVSTTGQWLEVGQDAPDRPHGPSASITNR